MVVIQELCPYWLYVAYSTILCAYVRQSNWSGFCITYHCGRLVRLDYNKTFTNSIEYVDIPLLYLTSKGKYKR